MCGLEKGEFDVMCGLENVDTGKQQAANRNSGFET
jgi:hypothetical protein